MRFFPLIGDFKSFRLCAFVSLWLNNYDQSKNSSSPYEEEEFHH